jgi:rubrerythrin
VPWDRLDSAKVDPDVVAVVKAAALVEYNAQDYAAVLRRVFADDPAFQDIAGEWAAEEVQHGAALGRWAELADPGFDFAAAVARFRAGYKLPAVAERQSARGSCTGELVARCMVETGTSSFYRAIGEASGEPVLRYLCRHIAADEFRHYKLFLEHKRRCLKREGVSRARLTAVAVSRIAETQDDELAYAYHAANWPDRPYDRQKAAQAYERRAFGFYREHHIERAAGMVVKACGFSPQSWWFGAVRRFSWWLVETRVRRLQRKAV